MKKTVTIVLLAITGLCNGQSNQPIQQTSAKTVTSENNTKQFKPEKYPFGIGFAGIFSPNPYKDTSPTVLPVPVITFQGENLTINGPYATYRFFNTKNMSTKAQLFLYPQTFRAIKSDDAQLKKLDNRNYLFMLGVKQTFKSRYGNVDFAVNIDITTRTNGYLLSTEYSKRVVFPISEQVLWFITPSLGLTYSSQKIVNYYYGVTRSESLISGIPGYNTRGAIDPYIGLTSLFNISQHWNIFVAARLSRLSNEIYHSPMVSQRYIITSFLSVTDNFDF